MTVRAFDQQQSSSLRLRIDQIDAATAETGASPETLYCTDAEGTQTRVEIAGSSQHWQRGQWYEFGSISRTEDITGAAFRFTPTEGSHTRIDPVSITPTDGQTAEPKMSQLGERSDRLGLTVVVVPTDEHEAVAPATPQSYELMAICLETVDSATAPAVYHREAAEHHDERLLLEHVYAELADTDAETIVAWQSGRTVALLASRHRYLKDGDVLTRDSAAVFEDLFHADLARLGTRHGHADLFETAQSLGLPAEYPQFDPGALDADPSEWRSDWALEQTPLGDGTDTRFTERDYRALIESHLSGATATPDALAACLQDFASAPLDVLQAVGDHEIAARLGCPRLTEAAVSHHL
jgi:hypothetical protein